jgi:CheY-like chemotaxis protein
MQRLDSANPTVAMSAALSKTVLLVDDVDASRLVSKWFLWNFGYEVDSARTAEEALILFDAKVHDAVITDNSMPGMTGLEMAHIIKLRSPKTPVIMFSGALPEDRSCLDVAIQKPAHLMAIKDALDKLCGGGTQTQRGLSPE